MPYKDKQRQVDYDKTRYLKDRPIIRTRVKKYYETNKSEIQSRGRRFYQNNRERLILQTGQRSRINLDAWKKYFPEVMQCGCCGKDIFFSGGIPGKSVYFDHRHGGGEPIRNPNIWLRSHKCTPENIKIWESCDFGRLCIKCNGYLPTVDRKHFIDGLMNYYKESIYVR